jgi:poly(A) polymerase
MRSSRHDIERVATLVELAGTVSAHTGAWSAADARRLAHRAGEHLADLLDLLVATEGEVTASTLRAAVAALAEAGDLDDLLPALTGDEVMSLLGLGPGPDVGAALEFLWASRLDDGPMTRESAMERLEEWWGARTEAD